MANTTWSNQMGSRDRAPWLLLIKGEQIVPFTGENIPGFVAVMGTDYEKNGKWSHTTYRLNLGADVRAIPGHNGWETGKFLEGLRTAIHSDAPIDTWADVAQALGVSAPSARKFLEGWRPKVAAALDAVDAALANL
ncbi:MAG: hypothetical protein AAB579_02005 [Patescibacteria group bacterium]